MALPRNILKYRDAFLKAGIVDDLQMRSASARLEQWGGRLAHVLVEMGFAKQDVVMKAVSDLFHMPVNHIEHVPKDALALAKIDVGTCEEKGVFPLSLKSRVLTLAVADPTEIVFIDELQQKGVRVQTVLVSEAEIRQAINRHYRGIVEHKPVDDGVDLSEPAPAAPDMSAGFIPVSQRNETEFDLEGGGSFLPPKAVKHAPPQPVAPPPDAFRKSPSANTLLDEMFEEQARPQGFTAEELQRLEAARVNQEKTSTILRALTELLREKGYLPRA